MKAQTFASAVDELSDWRTGPLVPELFVDCFMVDGAAVSTLGELLGSETVAASDDLSARLDELHFDLGEGPGWEAMSSAKAVVESDVRRGTTGSWPAFADAIAREDVGAVFALPMMVGPLRVGAIGMYSHSAHEMDADSAHQGEELASIVARRVFKQALSRVGREYLDDLGTPRSRRVLHQACGMVLAQLELSAADARLVIEGHAFATRTPAIDVAQRIVDRELVLSMSEDETDAR